jgi:hypothetical protein
MNYIRHLNAFFSYVKTDHRLTASHVSLYLALFHYWNFNRFNNPFSIYRDNIMQLSKLSKNTYHKCLKQLHESKYIYYHPSPSKFQAVRISIIRLDKEEEQPSQYKQLDLFRQSSPPLSEGDLGGGPGRNIETDSVANLSQTSPNIKTDTVANLRHIYKPNINKQRETPAHKIFERNNKIHNTVNELGSVSNLGHIPTLPEVKQFFDERNYPAEEAIKFFNHYKALDWKLQGKTPILDWKPLVEKWMQNAKKWETVSPAGGGNRAERRLGPEAGGGAKDLQYLYDSFLDGKNIFKHLTPEHFDQFKLELTNEILNEAWKQRINQVSGTNQHSLNDLWQAYLTNDPENELVKKDQPNFIALAKRIAVLNHFHKFKQSGSASLPP